MKKVAFLISVLLFLGYFLTNFDNDSRNQSIQNKINKYNIGDKQAKRDRPDEAVAWMNQFLQTDNTSVSPAQLNQYNKQEILQRSIINGPLGSSTPNFSIEEIGPGVFGGRVRAITSLISDSKVMLVGGVSGGIWKTTDGGNHWRAINDFLPNLAVASIIRDPDDENTVYIGTGEGFFNIDAMRGAGIFRSTDFGETWTQLPSTDNSDFHYVNRIVKIPATNTLIAVTRTGIHRSIDLGLNWTEVSGFTTSTRGFVDIKIDPTNANHILAVHYGNSSNRYVAQSIDGGLNWIRLDATNGLPTTGLGRMELAFGTDGVIYVAVASSSDTTLGLWRSPGGSNNFVKTASNTAFIERQGWYDLVISVDPSDSDHVLMGAVDQYVTNDAGATIAINTFWNPGAGQIPNYVHADQHIYYFDPNDSNTVYAGTDGGIFKSSDSGVSYENVNNNIGISQSYGIAVDPNGDFVTSGTQDNGSQLYYGDSSIWLEWHGGDGGYSAWDQQNGNFVYGSTPGGGMFGSDNKGLSSVSLNLPDTTGAGFIQPFTIDPNDGSRFIVGTDNMFFSDTIRSLGAATWSDVSGQLGQMSAVTISSVDGTQAFGGTVDGDLIRIDGLGTSNTVTDVSTGLPAGAITDVYVDPTDPTGDTLIVTQGSYFNNRINRSTNGGSTWTSISGNLPDIPLFVVISDPINPNTFFVGSELGLWVSEDVTITSPVWNRYTFGPAFTRIIDLVWNHNNLYIGTHGRGTFVAKKSYLDIKLDSVQVTNMVCDGDGILDIGETANILVSFTNTSGQNLDNVMATLSSTADVSITSALVNLGTILAGQTIIQPYEVNLISANTCPTALAFNVDVTHNTGNASDTIVIPGSANIETLVGPFTDGGETGNLSLMTQQQVFGLQGWQQVTTQANSGSKSWFSANEGAYADKSLTSPWLTSTGNNILSFALYYLTEGDATQRWDGTVLELRTPGSDWVDIGNLSSVPYDGLLFTNNTAPARLAWSGNQQSWRIATVDLSNSYQGQQIQFRFRMVNDSSFAEPEGFWIDDISMSNVTWQGEPTCDVCNSDIVFNNGFE